MASDLKVPRTIDQLSRLLLDLRLVSSAELQSCVHLLERNASVADLLQELEKKQLLTPFQSKRLESGETGMLVLGGCKLLYQNASGSFARVYRGCRIDTGQMIGVKVLRDRWAKDRDTVALFQREGEIGKRLKHPNIVPIFEVGLSGQHHFITMEFVEGGNLRDFMKIRQKLSPEEALQYGLHISRGLEGALAVGITHRDMKTTNVLLSSSGVAKLIDFGLGSDDALLQRTNNPDLAQALEYVTLEKNTGAPKNDPRSDLFFLGVILYELLTGELPYPRTKDRDERKDFSRYRDIRPIQTIAPDLPPSVLRLVARLLEISPAERHQTPTEVVDEISGILREMGHKVTPLAGGAALDTEAKVLLCVEHRANRQDLIRDYFTKKGYRVILLPDIDRALNRLKTMTPAGVVLFADSIGERIESDFKRALELTAGQQFKIAVVLGESQKDLMERFRTDEPRGVVLRQPISLRDLRKSLEFGAKRPL